MNSRTGVYGVAKQSNKILLITQAKGPYAGKYDLPGGKIEFGETIEGALHREFIEEVGMDFTSMELLTNLTARVEIPGGLFHQIGLIYSVSGLFPVATETELKYTWIDIATLKEEEVSSFVWAIRAFF